MAFYYCNRYISDFDHAFFTVRISNESKNVPRYLRGAFCCPYCALVAEWDSD